MSRFGKCLVGIFFATTLSAVAIRMWIPISNAIYSGTGVDLRMFLSRESVSIVDATLLVLVVSTLGLALYFSDE